MKKKKCSQCGQKNMANSKFCANCGNPTEPQILNTEVTHTSRKGSFSRNFWAAIAIFFIFLALLGYAGSQGIDAIKKESTRNRSVSIGERFSLSSDESVLIEEVRITDVIDIDRRVWIKIDYSKPSLDSLEVALFNSDRKVADMRINGQGVMEYVGIPIADARDEYSLVFKDGHEVKLDKFKYLEGADPFNTSLSESPQATTSIPQSSEDNSRNLSCSSSSLGETTFTNCHQY